MRVLRRDTGAGDMLQNETIRFVIAGSSAALLFYALTFAAIRLGAPPFAGTLGAYAITFLVSYSVQQSWTFRGRQGHARALPRYLAAQVTAAVVAGVAAHAVAGTGAGPAGAALASTLTGSALSYVLSKYWVFSNPT